MQDLHFGKDQYPPSLTVEQLDAAVRGKIHIYLGEDLCPIELTREELTAYERAKTKHYAMVEVGQERLKSSYRWYCEAAKICWVSIHFHKYDREKPDECLIDEEHVTVWFDLFYLGQRLAPTVLEKVRDYFERARSYLYEDADMNISETGGHGVVPEYAAEKLATRLYKVLIRSENL